MLGGLDEVPEEHRRRKLEVISSWMGEVRACVVTCRTVEFGEVLGELGERLSFAAVVEMRPISPDDAAEYLYSNSASRDRWRPVIDLVEREPDGPLAKSLTTPLMAYLTRTAYREPSTDPVRLTAFESTAEIEEHLFRA